jgi:xanthine dehydrogenase accessory factor
LISVIRVDGSAPREVGARMVVQHDAGFFGTIGGGRLEYEALAVAEAALPAETPAASVQVWPLGPNLGQCCGGRCYLIGAFDAGDLDIFELAPRRPGLCLVAYDPEPIARDLDGTLTPRKMGSLSQGAFRSGSARPAKRSCFGASHVSRAVVLALRSFDFGARIDTRPSFPDYVPANVTTVRTDAPERDRCRASGASGL